MTIVNLATTPNDQSILEKIEAAHPRLAESTLLNGARFLSAEVDNYPTSSIVVYFDAGSRREGPDEHGGLHFFEHLPAATFRIANDGLTLSEFASRRAWQLTININAERLAYGFVCPDYEASDAMKLLGEMLSYDRSQLQQVFAVEKGRILDEINKNIMNIDGNNGTFVYSQLMGNTGYAHPILGTYREVESYTFEKIMALGEKYLSPANATIAVSGSAETIHEAHNFFERAKFPGNAPAQGNFDISMRTPWSQIAPISFHVNQLLEGVYHSVLFPGPTDFNARERNAIAVISDAAALLVEKRLSHESGLTYGAGMGSYNFIDTQFFSCGANLSAEKLSKAHAVLMDTISEVVNGDVLNQKLIEDSYTQSRNRYYRSTSFKEQTGTLEYLAVCPHRRYIPNAESLRTLASLTPAELKLIAQRYLDPANARIFLHGKAEVLSRVDTKSLILC